MPNTALKTQFSTLKVNKVLTAPNYTAQDTTAVLCTFDLSARRTETLSIKRGVIPKRYTSSTEIKLCEAPLSTKNIVLS